MDRTLQLISFWVGRYGPYQCTLKNFYSRSQWRVKNVFEFTRSWFFSSSKKVIFWHTWTLNWDFTTFSRRACKICVWVCPQLLHSSESIIIKICQKIVLEWYARILVPCKLLVRIGKYWVFRPFLKVLGLWFQPFWAASIWRFFSHFNFSLWSAIFVMIYWPVFVQIRLELKSDPFVPRPVCSQLDPGEKLPPKKTSLMLLTKSSRPMPSSQLRPSIWHTIKNN